MTRPLFQAMLCLGASLALSCADDASTPNPIDTNTAQAPLKHFCKALTDKDDDGVIDIIEENQFGPNGSFTYTVKHPLIEPDTIYTKHEVNTDTAGKILSTSSFDYSSKTETKYAYNDIGQLIELTTTYSAIDHKTRKTSGTAELKKQFAYYDDGSLKTLYSSKTNELGTVEFTTKYTHSKNKIVAKTTYTKPERSSPNTYTKELFFNEDGKLRGVKEYDSRSNLLHKDQELSYDEDGLLITSRHQNTTNRYIYQDSVILKKLSTNPFSPSDDREKIITYDSEGRVLKQETKTARNISEDVRFTYEDNTINIYLRGDTKPQYILTTDQDNNIIKHSRASQHINGMPFPAITTTYDYSCLQGKPPVEPIMPAACDLQATTLDEYRKQPCDLRDSNDLSAPILQVPAVHQYVSLLKEVALSPSYRNHLNFINVY